MSHTGTGGTGSTIRISGLKVVDSAERSYLSEVCRQLNGREEDGLDESVGLVDEEHEEEADPHGNQEAQDDHPPGGHTCPGASHDQHFDQ